MALTPDVKLLTKSYKRHNFLTPRLRRTPPRKFSCRAENEALYRSAMHTADELRILARAYIDGTGIAETSLSRTITNSDRPRAGNSMLITRLLAGQSCGMKLGETASDWFDANWPADVQWPDLAGTKQAAE
jgi:hypothetical protein